MSAKAADLNQTVSHFYQGIIVALELICKHDEETIAEELIKMCDMETLRHIAMAEPDANKGTLTCLSRMRVREIQQPRPGGR